MPYDSLSVSVSDTVVPAIEVLVSPRVSVPLAPMLGSRLDHASALFSPVASRR